MGHNVHENGDCDSSMDIPAKRPTKNLKVHIQIIVDKTGIYCSNVKFGIPVPGVAEKLPVCNITLCTSINLGCF